MEPAVIETRRLLLRALGPDDLTELAVLHAQESFWWYPHRRGQSRDETSDFIARQCQSYEARGFGLMAVVTKDTEQLAGWAGLSAPEFLPEVLPAVEVGWRLAEAHRGMGYATEAGAASVDFGFTKLRLERILSIFEAENIASGRVMDRLGFTLDRITTHPTLGVPLHVRALTVQRWRELAAERV